MELEESTEGARIGAGVAGLHAVEDIERAAVGETFEGVGEGLIGGERVVGALLDVIDGCGEELGFDAGDPVEAPLGGDHFMDEVEFDGAVGVELEDVGVEEGVELGRVLGGEDDGLGGEPVLEGVLGRASAAGFGNGSAGFGAVEAGDLGFGWHVGRIREGGGIWAKKHREPIVAMRDCRAEKA